MQPIGLFFKCDGTMEGPIIRPDAAPHLHQLGRPEPARGRRGHRLHDGRARKRDGQFKEDDIRYV